MKFLTMVCCNVLAMAVAIPAAADAPDRGSRAHMRGQEQGQRSGRPPQRGPDQTPMPQRDLRGTGAGDFGQMSPDERRQLRRDIQDAGRDIYRPARQGSGERRRSERR